MMHYCDECGKPTTESEKIIRTLVDVKYYHEWCLDLVVAQERRKEEAHSDFMAKYYPPEKHTASSGMFS